MPVPPSPPLPPKGAVEEARARRVEFRHEGILPATVRGLDRTDRRKVRRVRKARYIRLAGRVHGNAEALIASNSSPLPPK